MAPEIEPMRRKHWPAVKQIYADGLATGLAAFIGSPPLWHAWNAAHIATGRSVAITNATVAGWAALARVADN
jgi:L-amino acid N-acyltransferase YncA